MNVQIFGLAKSADTRKAQRFFADRRIPVHFVDLKVRPASPGELRRFVQAHGIDAVIEKTGRRFRDAGLQHARLSDERWIARLADDPQLLRLPLVRSGPRVTVGPAADQWQQWVDAARTS